MNAEAVRTRIAPSPTGAPHIGTAYIALHNLAFARSCGGKFLLRIEDTDQARSSPVFEAQILEALRWLGIDWDEGPDIGGPFGPYRQSERLALYKEHAEILLRSKKAYRCFCSKERLDGLRAAQMAAKKDPGYDGHCRGLDRGEGDSRAAAGEPHVIRLLVDHAGKTSFRDELRKEDICFENSTIDDQVLVKADGFPTYHLASVVDDHLMRISHVLRGEEWISSTPKHVLLYDAFGWKPPLFRHLPLLRNVDKSKISKRKNPTSITWFRARGYAREAVVNFLGLMGYSREDGREHFSMEEMVAGYDPARLSSTSPVFDFEKLDSFNQHHIQGFDDESFAAWQKDAAGAAASYVRPLLPEIRKRCVRRSDLSRWTEFLFERELAYEAEAFRIKGFTQEQALSCLKAIAKELAAKEVSSAQHYRQVIDASCDAQGLDKQAAYMLLRISVMGEKASLPLFEVLEFCGLDLNLRRLKEASAFIRAMRPAKA